MDYIIIKEDKTPLCFENGYIIVYGDKEEANGDTIASDCGKIDATTGYIIGGVIGFAGLVSVLAIEVKSNKLIKEAGRRMTMIEIKGNGVNIKF